MNVNEGGSTPAQIPAAAYEANTYDSMINGLNLYLGRTIFDADQVLTKKF